MANVVPPAAAHVLHLTVESTGECLALLLFSDFSFQIATVENNGSRLAAQIIKNVCDNTT